jgi:hypothetical protein
LGLPWFTSYFDWFTCSHLASCRSTAHRHNPSTSPNPRLIQGALMANVSQEIVPELTVKLREDQQTYQTWYILKPLGRKARNMSEQPKQRKHRQIPIPKKNLGIQAGLRIVC